MNTRICILLATFAVTVLAAPNVAAQTSTSEPLNELVVALSNGEQQRYFRKNKEFVEVQTYFSKQYRLVRINVDVLLNDEEFSITLFEGDSLMVQRKSILHDSGYRRWFGMVAVPEVFSDPLVDADTGEVLPDNEQVTMREVLSTFDLDIIPWDHVGGELKPGWERAPGLQKNTPRKKKEATEYGVVLSIKGGLRDVDTGRRYAIEYIPEQPDVHIIYEIDETKRIELVESADGQQSVKNKSDLQKYNEFLETKGIDRGLGGVRSKKQRANEVRLWLIEQGHEQLDREKHPDLFEMLSEEGFDPTALRKDSKI